ARLLGDDRRLDRDLLGIGAFLPGLANAEDGVAEAKILNARADGADHAGKIAPQDIGKLRLLVVANAHLPIGTVDAGSDDIDHHLAWRGDRVGKVAVLQDLGPAVSFNESCFHLVPYLHDPQRRVDRSMARLPNGRPSDIHSALRPSFLVRALERAIALGMNSLTSPGDELKSPIAASRSPRLGSAMIRRISALSLATTDLGVPAGASNAYHSDATRSNPCSRNVGTF